MKDLKTKVLVVIAMWTLALAFVFCCANVFVDLCVLAGIIVSYFVIAKVFPEVHEEIFGEK